MRVGIGLAACCFPLAAQRAPLFKDEVLPVLEKSCTKCHSPQQKMGGLDLTTFAGLMAGGASGPVIAPGKASRSLLWVMIESGKMPLGGALNNAQKQLIRTYIEQGRFPAAELDAVTAAREAARITPQARQWWSFQRPRKAATPTVKHPDQVHTPIDHFILAKLEERGWQLQPEADRVTLLRRLSFGLTGLPPTPAQAKAFLDDRSPNAYEKLVDRLLASEAYGEHWGRHWLDIAGYSDSRGDASDTEREASWKYRDYVIKAFNSNKPVNRFLLEQIAGDQLVNYKHGATPTPEQIEPLIATGFLRTTADITDNQTIYEVDKYFDALQKATETSLSAVLGLSIGCARCHDHKFDPILQKDYYKLTAAYQAVWDPENWLAANLSFGPWPSRMVLDMPGQEREAWIADVTSNDAKTLRRLDDLLEATYQRFRTELRAGRELTAERRAAIRAQVEADPDLEVDRTVAKDGPTDQDFEKQYPEAAKWRDEISAKRAARRKKQSTVEPNFIEAAWDVSKTPSPTYILQRGNYLAPGAEVKPGIPAVLDNPAKPFEFPDPLAHPDWNHTGRRLTLAQWMVAPENPLVARVFVNRVWQFHFGEGLVRSVDDFGVQGDKPTHPELLDTLAVEFQESGWDLKRLTKQIVMSQAFRQASSEVPEYLAADPSAKLLWRKPPLRLEAEAIRDSMLLVSGLLSDKRLGRQEPIKRGADGQWLEDETKGNPNRRSVYVAQMRTRPVAFLHAFDAPTMTADNQTQRFRSALPSQSLALMNGPLVQRTTKAFADQVWEQSKGDADTAVRRAFEAAYNRPPSDRELSVAKRAMAAAAEPKEGLRLFLQAMLGANDFLYSY
ncbi:MAG: PSD1 and planctomycete cytochrome C domain-containing protein [Acidobacteria bacterium]|nr:PSD1 and planctomycete cytochrome C domain-containing protein [Acidobacteriota bacterium]